MIWKNKQWHISTQWSVHSCVKVPSACTVWNKRKKKHPKIMKSQINKQKEGTWNQENLADVLIWSGHSKINQKRHPTCFFQATQALTILSLLSFLLHIVPSHLQPQPDTFGDCRLRKCGLDHRHQFTCQWTSLRTDQVTLLLDAWYNSKVKGEVGRNDTTDSLLPKFFLTF